MADFRGDGYCRAEATQLRVPCVPFVVVWMTRYSLLRGGSAGESAFCRRAGRRRFGAGAYLAGGAGEREAAKTPEERRAFGGSYVEGMAGAPGRVNPLFASQNEADRTLTSLVFSGLTRLDKQGAPFPGPGRDVVDERGRARVDVPVACRAAVARRPAAGRRRRGVYLPHRAGPDAALAAAADGGAGGGEGLEA